MIKEKLKKGDDANKTKILKKLNQITDGNYEFTGNYEINWEIKELEEENK